MPIFKGAGGGERLGIGRGGAETRRRGERRGRGRELGRGWGFDAETRRTERPGTEVVGFDAEARRRGEAGKDAEKNKRDEVAENGETGHESGGDSTGRRSGVGKGGWVQPRGQAHLLPADCLRLAAVPSTRAPTVFGWLTLPGETSV